MVALVAGLVALRLVELVLETGHDSRHDCTPAAAAANDGVCAWPLCSVPDAAASVTAVLDAPLDLVDRV